MPSLCKSLLLLVLLALPPSIAFAEPPVRLSDAQIAEQIVRESRSAYYATGHPCACPDDLARNGSRCGGRSAYSRPGGAEPKCYASEVSKQEIEAYRSLH